MTFQNIDALCIYELVLVISVYGASVPPPASFSVSSILDPVLHPIVAAGSNKCEALKSFFGLTYEQMLEKNRTNFNEVLSIDHITKNGNIKHNLSETNYLKKLMVNAESVYFLVHGFMESSDGLMVQGVAPELLKQQRVKVFALDGRKVISLEYFRSSTYVRFMGQKFGTLLTDLIRRGVNASKITLIGHSLGAHIAGIAGKKVKERTGKSIARITGLDPAGPCFSNIDTGARLDASDAEYVDVIHTNGGMLGLKEPVGHKDFYPNNGMSQPGCFFSTCDHSRAWELFAESINSPDHFPARKCVNWTMFQNGLCTRNDVTYMGLNSGPGNSGSYFLTTGSSTPYSLGAAGSG
ncbi:phospholipase A1 VesT1.02-like isoform X1 [Maniola jurtina]|uniref:phospholipase A1 VesT1.02-like isoform X1 n=1 Tax=Maniola jurtina TaxID=191418 RepID=UPI001E68CCE1|nr:phospholipase A1 VesT1.02-like isoform X1 [Maniola jurtina]